MAVFPAALVLNVSDAGRAAEFLGRAVGYVRQQDAPDFLIPPNGEGLQLHLGEKSASRSESCRSTHRSR